MMRGALDEAGATVSAFVTSLRTQAGLYLEMLASVTTSGVTETIRGECAQVHIRCIGS